MDEVLTFNSPADEAAYYEQEIAKYFDGIDRLHNEMDESQKEIDRLRSETQEILERIKARLSCMDANPHHVQRLN
jgi:uncharacterized coiled-coil DUF342 family protein